MSEGARRRNEQQVVDEWVVMRLKGALGYIRERDSRPHSHTDHQQTSKSYDVKDCALLHRSVGLSFPMRRGRLFKAH